MRKPKKFIRFSNPIPIDNKHFATIVETEEGESLDLSIPINEVGAMIEFLVSVAAVVNPVRTTSPPPYWNPIRVERSGFSFGASPSETILFHQIGGFYLAFALDTNRLRQLASDFARIARTASASDDVCH